MLADIRAIATRALAYGDTGDIEKLVPRDLFEQYQADVATRHDADATPRGYTRSALAAGATAPTVAVGILIALNTLSASDINKAGQRLRWLVTTSRSQGKAVTATNVGWCRGTSTVLTGIQLSALGPMLKPSDQLRYRIGSELPSRPTLSGSETTQFAARLPTMLWPAWSLPLTIPTRTQKELRPALSCAVLLVGSKYTLAEATDLLRSPISGRAVSYVLRGLAADPNWTSLLTTLITMADYLNHNRPPIDYQRRRQLDYTELLPDREWSRIARATTTPGGHTARARTARRFLFEVLSGLPATQSPFPPSNSWATTKVADFPRYLTTELTEELTRYARTFLHSNGIENEPVQWTPPSSFLQNVDLPGPDPDTVSIPQLQRRIRPRGGLGDVAAEMKTTLDVVRYLLQTHPIPTPTNDSKRRPRAGAFGYAKKMLSEERLHDLYHRQGQSLREVAASVGVSRNVIARLAADYGIPLREPGRRPNQAYDPQWLYDQYVNQSRPLPAIAKDCGVSTSAVKRWADETGIPLRARGGPSHQDALAAPARAVAAPELIKPALQSAGGLQRLRRFAAIAGFPTLAEAAAELQTSESVLSVQIGRLERELQQKLFIRAQRGHPMKLTEAGQKVVSAIHAYTEHISDGGQAEG